jgi:hypothetical protein
VHEECFVSNPFFVCFVDFVVSHSDSELDSPKIAEKTKEEVGLLGRFTEASAEIYGTRSAAHRELVIAHRIRSPTRCKKVLEHLAKALTSRCEHVLIFL